MFLFISSEEKKKNDIFHHESGQRKWGDEEEGKEGRDPIDPAAFSATFVLLAGVIFTCKEAGAGSSVCVFAGTMSGGFEYGIM